MNWEGQLGGGTMTDRNTPVAVVWPSPPAFTSGTPAAGSFGTSFSQLYDLATKEPAPPRPEPMIRRRNT